MTWNGSEGVLIQLRRGKVGTITFIQSTAKPGSALIHPTGITKYRIGCD